MSDAPRRPVRIANCSGFFGDRIAAAREMVDGGPVDVLTGDWLAELTMLILARQRMKHGAGAGYARTFLTQMEQVLGTCLDRGVRVVTNAGGLDPQGLADALRAKADELGLGAVRIGVVTGDDLVTRLDDLRAQGEALVNMDTGEEFASLGVPALTANAYLGGRGITAALDAGADVVITGRVTDAALAVGPAAWWHGWSYDDAVTGDQDALDALAGAVVAGHVIECGAQATGGNYAFFTDVPGLEHVGFPIAEVAADGASVITKHEGTGGLVSVGTVTAQLLYEVGGPEYANPDVTARFDTIHLRQVGRDRVRISGVRGELPPARLKVSLNYLGGFRNTMSLVLTGLDADAKADLALRTVTGLTLDDVAADPDPRRLGPRSGLGVRELAVELQRDQGDDPATTAEAQAHLRLTVKDADPKKVGKPFTTAVVEAALGSYPGMFPTAPPADGTPYGVYWPTSVAADAVVQTVTLDGHEVGTVPGGGCAHGTQRQHREPSRHDADAHGPSVPVPPGPTRRLPLGAVAGARSGDKGGDANVGVWAPDPTEPEAVALAWGETDTLVALGVDAEHDTAAVWAEDSPLVPDPGLVIRADATFDWLVHTLTPDGVRRLLPEARNLDVDVYPLPNLRAVNVVIRGLLGRGVAESTRLDPQAKGLGEHLRARLVDVPTVLLPPADGEDADAAEGHA
ncbi:MAG: acyclic terpene utilization AtuA family protein [Candidatus Nanopelagicales bacterium]